MKPRPSSAPPSPRAAIPALALAAALCAAACPLAADDRGDRPNFLIILADDLTYNDLDLYGGRNVPTPHIDSIAARGVVFNQAYVSMAMCQPCRAELYTGQYPLRNGCAWNHSASRPGAESLPHHLRPLGYRVGIAGKIHVRPRRAFPFDEVEGFDRRAVNNPTEAHDTAPVRDYMDAGKHGAPFCLVVALTEPHVPWVMGDRSALRRPARLVLPRHLADTPETREAYLDYLAEIAYLDSQVGDILAALEESGAAENTLVLFSSEQGAQFPGAKWTNWNLGLRTALVAAWPGRIEGPRRTDALVQYADVAPTLVELAGGEPSAAFDGTSFAAVLRGESRIHRDYAYALHHNLPAGPPYPIRSVTDGRFRYIRNLSPGEVYIGRSLMGPGRRHAESYWNTWTGADPLEHPGIHRRVSRILRRPAEELYHSLEDPFELENLAGDPEHAAIQAELSASLDAWMESQGDPGAALDSPGALEAARRGDWEAVPRLGR